MFDEDDQISIDHDKWLEDHGGCYPIDLFDDMAHQGDDDHLWMDDFDESDLM